MKINLLFIICLLSGTWVQAQTTLQVVTQTIQKTVAWKPGYELEINGEKAEVQVEPSAGSNISVHAELIAKHPSLDSAKADVKAWKLVVSTVGKKVYVRAYIGVAAGKPLPVSNLKAKITVLIPPQCPVSLRNKFGQARLDQLQGPVALDGEFCNFTLTHLSGKVEVDSRYGNVEGRHLDGPVNIQSKRADVSLADLHSDCRVTSEYGAVRVDTGSQTGNLTVEANKSDVTLDVPAQPRHSFNLKAGYGQVQVPKNLPFSTGDGQSAVWQQGQNRPMVRVSTSFGKITVQ